MWYSSDSIIYVIALKIKDFLHGTGDKLIKPSTIRELTWTTYRITFSFRIIVFNEFIKLDYYITPTLMKEYVKLFVQKH